MSLAPGSFAWLLRHELRLAVRGTWVPRRWLARFGPRLLLAAVPAVAGVALAVVLAHAGGPPPHRGADSAELGLIGTAVVVLLVLMLSTATLAVLRTFHDRHDLDLLLAAPLPPDRVLAAKAVGVAVGVAAPLLVIYAPFALTSAVLGAPRWLGGLAIIAVDAALATAAALALAAGLFAVLGARRARVALQLVAAVAGAAVFLSTQVQSLSASAADRLYAAIASPWPPPLDWPARAARGEPLPLLAMVAVAALLLRLAAAAGGRRLLRAGEREGGTAAPRTRHVRFRSGTTTAIVVKELRLIARDPELIAQVALRLIYLIPLALLLLRAGEAAALPAAAAAATGFAGLLAASLAWIVVSAEEAPDLLAAAPRSPALVARAKLLAACVVPVGVVAAAALALVPVSAWTAAVMVATATLAATSAAVIQSWFARPAPRSAFRRRQSGSFVVGVGEIALAAAWASLAGMLVRGSVGAVVPALVAGTILAGAREAHAAAQREGGVTGAGGSGSSSSVSSSASARQPA